VRVVEFQRHSRDDQQKETGDHHDVQHTLKRGEPRKPLVAHLGADFGFPEGFGIMQEEIDGTEEPEEGMESEKGKGAHQQSCHGKEDEMEQGVMFAIRGIGVWNILGEVRRGPGMTLSAGLNDIVGGQPGLGIGWRQDVMMSMAVVAGGHLGGIMGGPQCNGLAVIGFQIVFKTILVAFPAALVTGGFEKPPHLGFDLVGAVAVGADRAAGIPFGEELAVNAFHVGCLHPHVTLPAGVGHMGVIDRGVAIHAPADIVNAVAVVTGGGHNQAEFEQGAAMDAFHVLAGGLWEFHFVFRRQIGVAVATRAGCRQV